MIERNYKPNTREMEGAGCFAKGHVEQTDDGRWYVDAAADDGRWYRGFVGTVFVGFEETYDGMELDVTEYDFRMGNDELHLRGSLE